jgi:hypothetical protein
LFVKPNTKQLVLFLKKMMIYHDNNINTYNGITINKTNKTGITKCKECNQFLSIKTFDFINNRNQKKTLTYNDIHFIIHHNKNINVNELNDYFNINNNDDYSIKYKSTIEWIKQPSVINYISNKGDKTITTNYVYLTHIDKEIINKGNLIISGSNSIYYTENEGLILLNDIDNLPTMIDDIKINIESPKSSLSIYPIGIYRIKKTKVDRIDYMPHNP